MNPSETSQRQDVAMNPTRAPSVHTKHRSTGMTFITFSCASLVLLMKAASALAL